MTRGEASIFACQGRKATERLCNGKVTLTTHRLLWFEREGPTRVNMCINLWDLRAVGANRGGRFKSSSKIQLFPSGQLPVNDPAVMLAVKGRDDFLESLQSALDRKAWVKETAAEIVGRRMAHSAGDTTSGAGIAGILRRQEANRKATSEIASEAFSDLNTLIQKAKEVVAVVERYSLALREKQAEASSNASSEVDDLDNLLLNIGIASPVTKSSAGTRYHQELARQLADFLSASRGRGATPLSLLARFGGMITLTDVFSLFNRARGTELVSPSDLLATAQLLGPVGLGMTLRRFDSGVMVIQADTHSDQAVSERLAKEAKEDSGGLVATQVARNMSVSVTLAVEHLNTAERSELLCRDESVEGTRFFTNLFDQFVSHLEEGNHIVDAV
ncbi:unnamed protein product [Choristocarpus tenellus]